MNKHISNRGSRRGRRSLLVVVAEAERRRRHATDSCRSFAIVESLGRETGRKQP